MMTLRQVEVVRAVMVTGTIEGAAKLLNVSAPGISRLVKYTEKSLGIRFFQRQNGRYRRARKRAASSSRSTASTRRSTI
jgi:DNA-binding transcriptional LysR family regulator